MAYNYLSGEPITGLPEGRPLFLRTPDSTFTLATFMRTQLYSIFATLRLGMNVLRDNESVELDRMFAHGGLFRTAGVAQRFLAAALRTPVTVGHTASEGGAWGIALLAAYRRHVLDGAGDGEDVGGRDLAAFLDTQVFTGGDLTTVKPDPTDVAGFDAFIARCVATLPVERTAAAIDPA